MAVLRIVPAEVTAANVRWHWAAEATAATRVRLGAAQLSPAPLRPGKGREELCRVVCCCLAALAPAAEQRGAGGGAWQDGCSAWVQAPAAPLPSRRPALFCSAGALSLPPRQVGTLGFPIFTALFKALLHLEGESTVLQNRKSRGIIRSWNHAGWKRPLRSSSLTITPTPPCLLNHVLKCHIHTFSEPLQGWGLHHFPGSLVQCSITVSVKKSFLISSLNLPGAT